MRFLALLALAVFPAAAQFFPFPDTGVASAGPSVSYIQGCTGFSTTDTVAACDLTVTAGDLLVVASKISANNGSTTPGVLTTSNPSGPSCTWAPAVSPVVIDTDGSGFNNIDGSLAYCVIGTTGTTTIQAAWTGDVKVAFADIAVGEYRMTNGWGSPALDVSTSLTVSGTVSSTCSTGITAATANPLELVVATCMSWNVGQTWGSVSGYSQRTSSSRNTTGWYDKSTSTTGTQTFSASITPDGNIGMIAAFKP